MNIETIEYNGNYYLFTRRKYEPNEIFMKRVWYILKRINSKKFNILELESFIWSNETILNCKYNL